MASYNIAESVIGVPLFVPDAHDYFEIVSGGMPNGDDSLRVRGDISADYKAYMPAPVTSPNVSANGTSWALTFWIKAPSTGGGGYDHDNGFYLKTLIMCVQNALQTGSGVSANTLWNVRASISAGALRISRGVTSNTSNCFEVSVGGRDGTWHMITVNFPSTSTTGYSYLDAAEVASGSDTQTVAGAPASSLYLCIGKYTTDATTTAYAVDYQLGKIAFHDHHLNATERAILYNAMVV